MKATGIVRRIDDLGRIVVPKEIRRTLRIREGDPLEIFTDRDGEIVLKKYSPIGELSQFAGEYAESLAQTTGHLHHLNFHFRPNLKNIEPKLKFISFRFSLLEPGSLHSD